VQYGCGFCKVSAAIAKYVSFFFSRVAQPIRTDKFPHEILVARFSQPALLQKKILSAMCRPRSRPPDVLYLWEAMKKNRIISEQDFRTLQECYAQSSSEVNRGGVPSGTGNNRNTTPSNKIQSFAHASKIDDLQEVLTTEFELHFTKEGKQWHLIAFVECVVNSLLQKEMKKLLKAF